MVNSVKLIEGVDAILLTSPSKIKNGFLHRTARFPPKSFRTKVGGSPVANGQHSPYDQTCHNLADDAPRIAVDKVIELQAIFEPPKHNLNRPAMVAEPADLRRTEPKQVRQNIDRLFRRDLYREDAILHVSSRQMDVLVFRHCARSN